MPSSPIKLVKRLVEASASPYAMEDGMSFNVPPPTKVTPQQYTDAKKKKKNKKMSDESTRSTTSHDESSNRSHSIGIRVREEA